MKKGSRKVIIETQQRVKDDESFVIDGARLVRFANYGQSRIWLDEHKVIDPGEAYTEAVDPGEGIFHRYRINFLTYANPPTEDIPRVYSGNRLHIRIFKEKDNG